MGFQSYSTTPALNTAVNGINIAEGCPPSGINDALRQIAADGRQLSLDVQNGTFTWGATSGGTGNAQTLTLNPALADYADGAEFRFVAGYTNTMAATLAVNGLAPVPVRRGDGTVALAGGEIVAGSLYIAVYETAGGSPRFRLLNPSTPPGVVLDRAYAENTAYANLYAGFGNANGWADTVPTVSGGTEILSVTIATATATERVRLRFRGFISCPIVTYVCAAIFRDGGTNAIVADNWYIPLNNPASQALEFEDVPGAGTHRYTLRIGVTSNAIGAYSGTYCVINGLASYSRFGGGTSRATLIAERIFA